MPAAATVEISCYFESLRNVDLLEQGLYCFRARICSDKDISGVPLVNFTTAMPARTVHNPRHQLFTPYIIATTNTYCSRCFWVQYMEEIINLNEVVVFRVELDANNFESQSVVLELDLMFSDSESIASPQQMQLVSQQKYQLNSIGMGLHKFYPLSFDNWHFCLIRFAVHSCLLDFSYKPPQKSLLRFSFTPCVSTQTTSEETTDTILFGAPCRRLLRESYRRLENKFKLISSRLSTKQQISHASFLKSPQLIERRDKSANIQERSAFNGDHEAIITIPLPAPPSKGPSSQDPVINDIVNEFHFLGEQIFELWQRHLVLFSMAGREDTFRLSQRYDKKCADDWKELFFRERAEISSIEELLALRSNPHRQMAESIRSSSYYLQLRPYPIVPICLKPEQSAQPIVFEQILRLRPPTADIYFDDSPVPGASAEKSQRSDSLSPYNLQLPQVNFVKDGKDYEGVHLFVLLHGLLGNSWDMRLFRNQIAAAVPDSEFLLCSSIEQMTLLDIEDMGVAVANEIYDFINNSELKVGRLSFVGHSLGGIVLRAALKHTVMQPYLCKMHTFVSLSVPHLGTLYPNSQLIPGAMWVWQKWTNSLCLKQLRLMDHPDPYKTYLYKLSMEKGLEHFQHIFLVSSEQDAYVPFHSARIELRKDILSDPKQGPLFISMARNLWQPLISKYVVNCDNVDCFAGLVKKNGCARYPTEKELSVIARYDVAFASHRGVDGVIGRAAHIRLLDNPKLMQAFISNNREYFS